MSGAGHEAPSITLNEGNCRGEKRVRVLQTFPVGTKYAMVTVRAKELANEMGLPLGRNFSTDEWSGFEIGSEEWKQWKAATKTLGKQ